MVYSIQYGLQVLITRFNVICTRGVPLATSRSVGFYPLTLQVSGRLQQTPRSTSPASRSGTQSVGIRRVETKLCIISDNTGGKK